MSPLGAHENVASRFVDDLSAEKLDGLWSHARIEHYRQGESIFNAGQPADRVYFIKTGQVSIVATQFANKKVIATLGPGDCFGEMAFFSNDIRTASVVSGEDADLLSLGKKDFLAVVKTRRRIAEKIDAMLDARREALTLKENILSGSNVSGENLRVSIKGDPSLGESALHRERY